MLIVYEQTKRFNFMENRKRMKMDGKRMGKPEEPEEPEEKGNRNTTK
jgi:hypothetical protein